MLNALRELRTGASLNTQADVGLLSDFASEAALRRLLAHVWFCPPSDAGLYGVPYVDEYVLGGQHMERGIA